MPVPQLRIALLEDNPDSARRLLEQLVDAGYLVTGSAASLEEISRLLVDHESDTIVIGMESKNRLDRDIMGENALTLFGLPVRLWESDSSDICGLPAVSGTGESLLTVTALESAADGILIVDGDQRVQYLNTVATQLTGWSLIAASGQNYHKILVLEADGELVTNDFVRLATLNAEPLSLGRGLTLVARDGQHRQIEAEVSAGTPAVRNFGCVVFTLRDITSRIWEERQQRQEQTIRAVERLAESTAHSLGNLLTRILGNGDLLIHHPKVPADVRELVVEMNDAAHKVAEVVRQLSNISRTTFVTQQELDVNAAIQELMKRIAGRVPRGVVVQTSFDPELQKISADQGQLDQILFSLISNALEACDAKGTITIETNNATLEPSEGYKSMRHFVSVTVRDTGHGIPKDELPQIFEPFFTTRKDAGHAGLGLAISQGLIRDYHGFLDVTSQVGVGTEVRFGLPAIQADPFAYLDDAYRTVKQKSILLVEDDHAVRLLLRKILERNKYSILEARDGEEALFVADLHRGNIDLMVTDVHMPRVTGPELVRQFAPLHPETKYLLISGFSPSKIQASSLPPDVRFLQKPFDQKSLLLHIRGLLEIDTN